MITVYKGDSITWVEPKRLNSFLEDGWSLTEENKDDEEIKVTLKPAKRSKK